MTRIQGKRLCTFDGFLLRFEVAVRASNDTADPSLCLLVRFPIVGVILNIGFCIAAN